MKRKAFVLVLAAALQFNVMGAELGSINGGSSTGQMAGNAEEVNKGILGSVDDIAIQQEKEDQVSTINQHAIVKEIGTHSICIDLLGGSIFLNGARTGGSAKCVMKEDVAYVPLKTIVTSIYNGKLTYDKATGYVEGDIEGLTFKFKLGSKQGYKNGSLVSIERPFTMINGAIYIPVKSMPKLFNMEMSYLQAERKIILTAPERYTPLIITSFADFDFDESYYVQGQKVSATDKSYDVDGRMITEKKWMLDGDKNKTSTDINKLFEKAAAGTHRVSLLVKNIDGGCSEWTTKEITIFSNEKPVIKEITSKKQSYAQGEEISLSYTYDNEEWEEITDEKWTYKRVGEDEKSKVYLKPQFIFYQGEYEVGLQIKDAYGNWSEPYTWTLHISDEVKDTELNFKFTKNEAGTIIDNFQGRNYREFEQVELEQTGKDTGTYILSDSPEIVTKNGILYEDYIEGKGRINFHHINNYPDAAKNKKIVVMAENVTDQPITITLMDKIIKGPSIDALYVGQLLLYHYFRGNGHTSYTLKPGEKLFLINTEDKNWEKNSLIAGQMDMYTSGKVKFTIASADKGMTTASISYLPYLPTTIHPRGTFDTTDLYYEVTADGTKETYFLIGGNSEEWCTGIDAIKNQFVSDTGNYGIVYHVKIKAEEDMGIFLNPRGGAFRGAVRVNGIYTYMIPSTSYFGGDSTKAAVIATVKRGESVEIEYSLPNGSSAPVLFGMVPKTFWKTK